MLKQPAVVNFVEARVEFLVLNQKAGVQEGSEKHKKLSESTVAAFEGQLRSAPCVSQSDANRIIQLLLGAPLTDADREKCIECVNEKLTQLQQPGLEQQDVLKQGGAKQVVQWPEKYLTAGDWEIMLNPQVAVHARVHRLAKRFVGLGLQYPTEPSVKAIVALTLLDQGDPACLIDPALLHMRTFKNALKTMSSKNAAALPTFPAHAATFKTEWPTFYKAGYAEGEEPTDAAPVDTSRLQLLVGTLGCRSTRTGALAGPTCGSRLAVSAHSAQLHKGFDPMAALSTLVQTLVGARQEARQETDRIPGLKLLRSPTREAKRGAQSSVVLADTSRQGACVPTSQGGPQVEAGPTSHQDARVPTSQGGPQVEAGPTSVEAGPTSQSEPAGMVEKMQAMLRTKQNTAAKQKETIVS